MHDLSFLQNMHAKQLVDIGNVSFTRREIDVISCILNVRGTDKIASLLSISSSTVESHIHNIRLKIGCNSRERMIDFVEKSHKFPFVKQHYAGLALYKAFERGLQDIAKLKKGERKTCLIVYEDNYEFKEVFTHYLKLHLEWARIAVDISEGEDEEETLKSKNLSLFIYLRKQAANAVSKELSPQNYLEISENSSYYLAVFEIIKKLFPSSSIERIFLQFKEQYAGMHVSLEYKLPKSYEDEKLATHSKRIFNTIVETLKNRKWGLIFGILLICFLFFEIQKLQKGKVPQEQKERVFSQVPKKLFIQPNFILPSEMFLLDRPELITQTSQKFKESHNIQALLLIGPGGSGKTTLARQYGNQQDISILWEINASIPETLRLSFENFAKALSQTGKDQKILREISEIQDSSQREEKILQFVKEHLKLTPGWLLLYDNVIKFTDIQKYFPTDTHSWGKGRVILTTRNGHMKNESPIHHAVHVGELSAQERLNLFIKIISNGKSHQFTKTQEKQAQAFLNNLPSFPLDISTAAYYLKFSNISYNEYLKRLNDYDKGFLAIQENVLRETGGYTKTRYSIITLLLETVLSLHKDFEDLFLLISLLDSQYIPRSLLDSYKSNIIVDNFIYHLKKHSLITDTTLPSSSLNPAFSVHRSTQTIILHYLTHKLALKKNPHLIASLSIPLESYLNDIIEQEDFLKMKLLTPHLTTVLTHTSLLPSSTKNAIEAKLGCFYYYTHHHERAKKLLENAILTLRKDSSPSDYKSLAQALAYLGNVHKDIGDHERGRKLLEESIALYKNYDSKNYTGLTRALAHLGDAYKNLGNNDQARKVLEESLAIFNKHLCNNPTERARTMLYLGIVYRELGDCTKAITLLKNSLKLFYTYTPENYVGIARALKYLGNVYRSIGRYEEAKDLLEKSLQICEKYLSDNQTALARSLVHLATIHKSLGNYEKAIALLNQSLEIHKKLFGEHNVRPFWVLTNLGNVYREMGEYERARLLIQESLDAYKQAYESNNIRASWVALQLGCVYEDLQSYDQAKELLEQSLKVHKAHFKEDHIKIAFILFHLGNVYRGLGECKKAKKFLEKALLIYEKHYGKEHIETAKVLDSLGRNYLCEGKIEMAERLVKQALKIFQLKNHPSIFLPLESLAQVYLSKAQEERNKGHLEKARIFKDIALNNLNRALEVVRGHFSKDSEHLKKIQGVLHHSHVFLED